MEKEVIPFKKYNLLEGLDLLPQEIVPRKLSVDDIAFRDDHHMTDGWLSKILTQEPLDTESQKVFLYHEGENGNFLSGNHYKYFYERGYEILEKPSPSLLIDAAQELAKDRERLYNLGLSDALNFTLLSTPPLFTPHGLECFLNAQYDFEKNHYKVCLISADFIECKDSIFLLRKL